MILLYYNNDNIVVFLQDIKDLLNPAKTNLKIHENPQVQYCMLDVQYCNCLNVVHPVFRCHLQLYLSFRMQIWFERLY